MAKSAKRVDYGVSRTNKRTDFTLVVDILKERRGVRIFLGIEAVFLTLSAVMFTSAPALDPTTVVRDAPFYDVWGVVFLSWALLVAAAAVLLVVMDRLPRRSTVQND